MTCKHGSEWCPGFDQWHSQLPRPCSGCVTEAQAELVRLQCVAQRLVDIDWCVGYELTTEQMEELDEIRTDLYTLYHEQRRNNANRTTT
jgi:hypothetical protein